MRHYGFIIKGVQGGKPWHDAWQVLSGSPKEARAQVERGLAEEKAGGYDRKVQEIIQSTDCDDDFELGVKMYDKLCEKVKKMNSVPKEPQEEPKEEAKKNV